MDDQELLQGFVEETQGHLQSVEPDLLELEKEGDNVDEEVVNRIFRSVHSVKGASGFFGLKNIGKLSHTMETLLALLRSKEISMSSELTDALFEGIDNLRIMIDDIGTSESFDISENLERLQNLLERYNKEIETGGKSVPEQEITGGGEEISKGMGYSISEEEIEKLLQGGKMLYSITVSLNEDLADEGKTPLEYFNNLETLGEIVDSFLESNMTGLDDCLDSDSEYHILYSTVLDQDLISTGVEVNDEKILLIDLKEKKEEILKKLLGIIKKEPAGTEEKEPDIIPEVKPETKTVVKPETKPAEPAKPQKVAKKIVAEEKLKVGVNLLNDLVNLAGELVLGRNQLMQISEPLEKETPGLKNVFAHVSRITTEMQEKIMHLRMQPVSILFSKFHRVIRDLSRNLKKEIALQTFGEEVDLDKSIIESLSDPLTHLIRNSVDHGVELPDEREKAGKPRQGTIVLKAFHEGGQVHIEIADDGNGIDANKVGGKAIEKGLITEEQMEKMSEKELVKLIFKPGFSTAQQVSSVSGRGVGMDVVITNIEKLGGSVEIDSVFGQGTTMRLILPLTLAIVSGLIIKVNDEKFIIPEVSIDEMVRIKCEEIKERINKVQDTYVLRLREKILPLINLSRILYGKDEKAFLKESSSGKKPIRVLILKYGTSRFSMIVDSVENFEEIVVKPLPRFFKKIKYITGTTIMGDGTVSFILDIAGIVGAAGLKDIGEIDSEMFDIDRTDHEEGDKQSMLILGNGTDEQFAVPLELISRLERISAEGIEVIKNRKYIQYQGENLNLIFLEDYLPVNRPDNGSDQNLKVLIPRQMKYPVGIVFRDIIDTVRADIELDKKTIMAPGLFGSAVLNKKITLLIDMFKLFEIASPEWAKPARAPENENDRRRCILLVEDTPFFRMVETDYLKEAGYDVIQAENGVKALEVLDQNEIDAVILDIIMPEMDGWETIEKIRGDIRFKDLPVLAVTSLWDNESRKRGLKSGFTDWEAKLNKTSLLEKLSGMLSHSEVI